MYLKILYPCLEKEIYKAGRVSHLVLFAALNRLKNLSAAVNATKKRPEFCQKRVN